MAVTTITSNKHQFEKHTKAQVSNNSLYCNGILVPVRTSFSLRRRSGKQRMYQCRVDVDMLNAVKSLLADVSSISPSSEQRVFTAVC